MKPQSILVLLLALSATFTLSAKKKDYPLAEIKVGYTYHETFVRGSDGIVKKEIPFVLLANKQQSKFYNAHTEFKDSLQSTPQGRALSSQMLSAAIDKYTASKDMGAMDAVVYHTFLYVFSSKPENKMEVYDRSGSLEFGTYTEPLGEIQWQISDSTKTILGYECVMATTDYHGRHWTAWFTPDIPLQDGPWKLSGLPGLILEATESTGQHSFIANGLEASDKEMVPVYPFRQYDKMTRINMLRQQYNYSNHGRAIDAATTGFAFGTDHIKTEEEAKIDFLETDYHE
ncbi:MAG: GLPGLI family protein [Staphylococcus sp.]|nr:GLPGLI family protein [Staphylococcus sp.]